MTSKAWLGVVLASLASCRARPHPTGALGLAPCELTSPGAAPVPARCGVLHMAGAVVGAVPAPSPDAPAPGPPALEVRVAVVAATSGDPLADAVVYVPDGPGQAATERFAADAPALARVRRERDVVLVDWPGSSGAGRLRCPGTDDPESLPLAEAAAWAERCARALAIDPRAFGTAAAARDLEAVRVALGYERLSLVGVAYGSRLALAYARAHPDRVRALVLAGAAPLEVAFGGDADLNAGNALNAVANRCERDVACARALPGLRDALPRVLERLERTEGDRAAALLRRGVLVGLASSATAARLPALAHAARGGKPAPLLDEARHLAGDAARRVSEPLRLTVLCSEDVPFFGAPTAGRTFLGASLRERLEALCRVWPRAPAEPAMKEPLAGETPAVVLSGTADPTTPPRYGDLVAGRLRRTIHLVVGGLAHDLLGRGCVPDLVATFVERGGEGGLDATCVRDVTPPPLVVDLRPAP